MKLHVEVVLCVVRETDWGDIVLVDETVTVKVLVTDVAEGSQVRGVGVVRTVCKFFLSVEESVAYKSETLSDSMACSVHPRIRVACLCLVDDLVASPAEVTTDSISKVTYCV